MASRSRGGLSDDQLAQLRDDVAAGKSPRVRIDGSQFGAAASGAVRSIGDPAVDGDDFITVRVKVNGVTDDLRFAPRELTRGGRAAATAKAPARRAPAEAPAQFAPAEPPAQPAPAEPPAPRTPADAPARKSRRRPTSRPARSETPAPPPDEVPRPATRKSARRQPPGAPVTIVVTSKGATWTVAARRGSRVVVKDTAVPPGAVSAIAGLLDVPFLEEAVAAVNDTARAEAETRAEQLRAELAQIQAVLDSHRRP